MKILNNIITGFVVAVLGASVLGLLAMRDTGIKNSNSIKLIIEYMRTGELSQEYKDENFSSYDIEEIVRTENYC